MWWSTSTRCTRARELEHQLADSGAEAVIVLENFAHTLEECIDRTPRAARGAGRDGRPARLLARPAGSTSPCATSQRMVPEFRLPLDGGRTVTPFSDALTDGVATVAARRSTSAPTTWPSCSTRGAPPACPRAPRCCTATWWPTSCSARPGSSPCSTASGDQHTDHRLRAAAVSHLRAHHLRADGRALRRDEPADPEPARHPRAWCARWRKHRINMFPAVNTLFNALANDADFARLDFSGLVVSNGGGMAVQQATAERWLKVTGCPVVEGYGLSETSPVATSQPPRPAGLHRHHRPADPVHRNRHPRRRRPRRAAGHGRRDLHPRPAGDGRLLATATTRPPRS